MKTSKRLNIFFTIKIDTSIRLSVLVALA